MCETDEYDDLEVDALDAQFLDDYDCGENRQIDEYGNYGIDEHYYPNSGCGCLTLVLPALLLAMTAALLMVSAF